MTVKFVICAALCCASYLAAAQSCKDIPWSILEGEEFYRLSPTNRTNLLTNRVYECHALRRIKKENLRVNNNVIDANVHLTTG